jgi:ankyrin repeat protein
MAAEQATAKAAEEARYAALVAERDKLKAECQAEMREALSKLSFKNSLRRIETMPDFECTFIKDGISLAKFSTSSIFKPRASTPLQIAAFDGDLQKVQQLVTCSITFPVNGCGSSGLSPLWLAVYGNHFEVVKELLKHGANYNMVCERANNDIKTPYELATKHAKSCTKNSVAILDLFNAYDRELFSSFDSF